MSYCKRRFCEWVDWKAYLHGAEGGVGGGIGPLFFFGGEESFHLKGVFPSFSSYSFLFLF